MSRYPRNEERIDATIIQPCHQFQRRIALRAAPAAMLGIEQELVDHILPLQRLLRATAQMRLPLFYHAAIPEGGADVAGVIVWIGVVGIDHEFNFGGECQHAVVANGPIREGAEPNAAVHKTCRQQIRHRELGGIAVTRPLFAGQRLPQPVHRPLRHLADDLGDVFGFDAPRSQPARAIDIGLGHRPARIGLERQRVRYPSRAEIACQRVVIAARGVREAVEQPVHALEHRPRTGKPSRANNAARIPIAPPIRHAAVWSRRLPRDIR